MVSIAAELGMYIPVPLVGYMADKYGPACVGILATLLFTPGYYISGLIIKSAQEKLAEGITDPDLLISSFQLKLLLACFTAIGTATSSLHFCGVVTAAKVLPQVPGLSISGPIAAFGISSLWQSQVINWFFIDSSDGSSWVKLGPVFNFFAVLYFITGIVGYSATRIGTFLVSDHQLEDLNEAQNAERQTLLPSVPSDLDLHQAGYGSTGPDNNKKTPQNVSSKSKAPDFFRDPTVYILFFSFILATGPLEMFVNDMGMIVNTIKDNAIYGLPVASHVSLFSAFSTIARLSMGIISDVLERHISRAYLLSLIFLFTAFSHILIASGALTVAGQGRYFFVASASNGFSYGSAFTLTPTIIAAVWGLERYGTNWGTFVLGPSIGATVYGYIFAKVYESAAERQINNDINNLESAGMYLGRRAAEFTDKAMDLLSGANIVGALGKPKKEALECYGLHCYQNTFVITGLGFIISAFLVMLIYRIFWRPKHQLAPHPTHELA